MVQLLLVLCFIAVTVLAFPPPPSGDEPPFRDLPDDVKAKIVEHIKEDGSLDPKDNEELPNAFDESEETFNAYVAELLADCDEEGSSGSSESDEVDACETLIDFLINELPKKIQKPLEAAGQPVRDKKKRAIRPPPSPEVMQKIVEQLKQNPPLGASGDDVDELVAALKEGKESFKVKMDDMMNSCDGNKCKEEVKAYMDKLKRFFKSLALGIGPSPPVRRRRKRDTAEEKAEAEVEAAARNYLKDNRPPIKPEDMQAFLEAEDLEDAAEELLEKCDQDDKCDEEKLYQYFNNLYAFLVEKFGDSFDRQDYDDY